MVDAINRTMNREFSLSERPGPKSLNISRRREELRLITGSNLRLLDRLERARSEYSHKQLRKEFDQNKRYALNSSFSLRRQCEALARGVRVTLKQSSGPT